MRISLFRPVVVAACLVSELGVAAEIKTAVGVVETGPLGEAIYHVERWPSSGRVEAPAALAQIVAAQRSTDKGPQPVSFFYDAKTQRTTLLLYTDKDHPQSTDIRLQASDATQQFADGRIVFNAPQAKIEGSASKFEESPGHSCIVWVSADDYVTWDYSATRWGKYNVKLTYSAPSDDAAEISVQLGDAKVRGKLRSTDQWQRYTTIDLGDIYVNEGKQTLSVKCVKPSGGAVMNLKAVILTPACEGTPPVQADDGVVTLHSRDSIVHGTVLRYEPAEKKQTLGYWVRREDGASWNFKLTTPGVYDVEVLQGCGTGQGGSTMAVRAGDGEPLEFVVEDTGHFQNFKPRVVGQVKFASAGEQSLAVQPKTIAKAAACDIRQIRLLPVIAP